VQQRGTYRFPSGLPISMSGQIGRINGVAGVGATRSLVGYHVDPHNHVGITVVDDGMRAAWATDGPLKPEQWNRLSAVPTGIFPSAKAAEKWSLKPGDTFTVITGPQVSRIDGGNAWEFHVLDVVPDNPSSRSDDGFILGNSRYIENSLSDDQRGLGYSFQVAVRDVNRAVEISKLIDERFANSGTPVMTTPNRINALHQLNRGLDTESMTAAIASAGLVVILFVTGSAIARSVRERVPEFAALSAVGYRNSQLLLLVFTEAAIPCVLGAVLGTALGGLLERWVPKFLAPGPAHLLSIPAPQLSVLGWGVGFALVLALLGSFLPMLRMQYQSVNEAMAGR
jgi:putative ABC transport system permease protein